MGPGKGDGVCLPAVAHLRELRQNPGGPAIGGVEDRSSQEEAGAEDSSVVIQEGGAVEGEPQGTCVAAGALQRTHLLPGAAPVVGAVDAGVRDGPQPDGV